jgi:DnaJ-class molecular chaperone
VSYSQRDTQSSQTQTRILEKTRFANSYYGILGLHPSASPLEIRRTYRELSKRFHPDTTTLPVQEAKSLFQQLNEAYATLSNPERRSLYDLQIGYSRWNVIQPSANFQQHQDLDNFDYSRSAYLDPTDRPLSAGEIFALLIMLSTLGGCLLLAIGIAYFRNSLS